MQKNNNLIVTRLSWRWLIVLAVAFGFFGYSLFSERSQSLHGIPIEPIEPAPNFNLLNKNMETVSLDSFRGEYTLLYFGFTNCPDECPVTMAEWKQVYETLGADASQVNFIFISVDPVRDTPDVLNKYLSVFNPAFIGLTGSIDKLEEITREYSAFFVKIPVTGTASEDEHSHAEGTDGMAHGHEDEEYLVDHTTLIHLIDRDGNLIRVYPFDTTAEDLARDLQYFVNQ